MFEVWKDVIGWEGCYEISNLGNVRSWQNNRWGKLEQPRLLRPGSSRGYLQFQAQRNGLKSMLAIHREVMRAFVGPCPDGMEVRHLNGVRSDNRLENLDYSTHAINMADAVKHDAMTKGEIHSKAKLTEQQARDLKEEYAGTSITQTELGKKFGISQSAVSLIINSKNWRHINHNT